MEESQTSAAAQEAQARQIKGLQEQLKATTELMQVMNDPQELNLTVERDGQQYDIYIQL